MTLIRHNCRTLVLSVMAVCMAWHAAVRAQPAPAAASALSSSTASAESSPPQPACLPACRSGFTCIAGSCVSACNPACDAGEFCTKDGECRAKPVQAQQPASVQKSETNSAKAAKAPVDNTHTNNPAMLIGGMVLSSLGAFVGGLGYFRIHRDEVRCDGGLTAWCSTSKPGIALATAGGVMLAVGIPFIVVGARRVPNATQTSWVAPPTNDRVTISLALGGFALSGTF